MKFFKLSLFSLLLFSVGLMAQDDIINSNRPGFSVSPYNVGKGNFQIESGFSFEKQDGSNQKNYGLDLSLRYAFNSTLEIYSDISNVIVQVIV